MTYNGFYHYRHSLEHIKASEIYHYQISGEAMFFRRIVDDRKYDSDQEYSDAGARYQPNCLHIFFFRWLKFPSPGAYRSPIRPTNKPNP